MTGRKAVFHQGDRRTGDLAFHQVMASATMPAIKDWQSGEGGKLLFGRLLSETEIHRITDVRHCCCFAMKINATEKDNRNCRRQSGARESQHNHQVVLRTWTSA